MEESINYVEILKKKKAVLAVKRFFDIMASFFGLMFLLLPFCIVAIIIKCTSEGPVFYKQVRVGKDGKEFKIFKFRTMVVDADKKGLQITTKNDNRVTKIGAILRKTKLDELPQLINVLIGDMSFVGPRPEVPKYVALYNEEQRNVLLVRPGITELSSILFRDENEMLDAAENPEKVYIEEIMPKKISYNLEYLTKIGPFYDLKLIFRTIGIMFK